MAFAGIAFEAAAFAHAGAFRQSPERFAGFIFLARNAAPMMIAQDGAGVGVQRHQRDRRSLTHEPGNTSDRTNFSRDVVKR